MAFALVSMNLFSQGFRVYTKDGQSQEYVVEDVDSIVFFDSQEAVDLGLSVKWATCNLGASSPEEYGGYYSWGETEEKSCYDWTTYEYYKDASYTNIGSNISGTQYDVVRAKLGGNWRMPTVSEMEELVNNCTWTWTTLNGVNGQFVTAPNGNSIFLPAAGYRYYTGSPTANSSYGYYWSATLYEDSSFGDKAHYLSFGKGTRYTHTNEKRIYGYTIRPVTE